MFPIHHALRDESEEDADRSTPPSGLQIRHAAGDESPGLRPELSWTHYRLLLGIDNPAARECGAGSPISRQVKRAQTFL
jgi:hypothetical protein